MGYKKISYREIKKEQLEDLKKNVMNFHFYRYFSTPFTYIFVKLGISPNAITISSFFLCLAGFYFLAKGTYLDILISMLFFVLFKTMDMSDGEVARIQNSPSIEGMYFDRISHYIFSLSIGIGFGIGLTKLYNNEIYLLLGFIFALAFMLEFAMKDLLKFFLREAIIKIGKKGIQKLSMKEIDRIIWKKFTQGMYKGKSWEQGNFLSRLIGFYPFQGLIYIDTIVIPIFIVLIAIESYFAIAGREIIFYGYEISLVAFYVIIICISKLIWISLFIYKIERYRHITNTLKEI